MSLDFQDRWLGAELLFELFEYDRVDKGEVLVLVDLFGS